MANKTNNRGITGKRAIRYAKNASSLVTSNDLTPEERKQYFEAIKVLRNLSDKYCVFHNIPVDED